MIYYLKSTNHISGSMGCMLTSSAIDHGFESWSGQTKDQKIGICCFSAEHAALGRNLSEWGGMSFLGLLFQWAKHYKNPIKHVGLVQSRPHHYPVED
jgi:hypothetical protein